MIVLYYLLLLLFSIFSYSLIDPNLTFFQTDWWVTFRNAMVNLGYYHRDISSWIYIIFTILFFVFHLFFLKNYKKINPFSIALMTGLIVIISYPFLSHDFFNYMFDAKIVTFYHKNPYLFRALDFPSDQWLRFMHWTHRTYPYGPSFLLITLIPSLLSFGKFVIDFFLFKLTFILFYVGAVYVLKKQNPRWAVFFATHPLVIIEGLVNVHNDLIALALAVIGVYFMIRKNNIAGWFFLFSSAGIKYLTAPLLLWRRSSPKLHKFLLFLILGALIYLSVKSEIQPWYFLVLFAFLPAFEDIIQKFQLFFAGLLFSYYPYIRYGGWDSSDKIQMKHQIIIFFLFLNTIYLVWHYWQLRKRNYFPSIKFFSK